MQTWVIGNWKMNGSRPQVEAFVQALLAGLPEGWREAHVSVALCPPYPYLEAMEQRLRGSGVLLGAQHVHPVSSGAFTGEVSPAMLREFGAALCLAGHSERRHNFGESDRIVAQQVHGLLEAELMPVLCVGETLAQREAGEQEAVIRAQVLEACEATTSEGAGRRHGELVHLEHPALAAGQLQRMLFAYEPVWAIGTGRNASPEQANEMHGFIRRLLSERFGAAAAAEVPILYGGSVNPGNASALLAQPEINGALVGGASLKAETFLPIIQQSLN
jgi:triosephosphate isomerase (TIM)